MEITKSVRWGRSGRWRAGLAVAGVAAIGTASLLGPGTTAEARGAGGGDVRSRLQRDADAVRDTGATGLTVLARDAAGRETQARSGTASLKDGGRVPFDAYYRIGSDTKTFTAVAALQLVGEGTLSLEDTVEQWLPGVVAGNGNDGSRITLRNLLQHTSGMIMVGEWELPTLKKSGIPLGAAPSPQLFGKPAVYTDSHAFVLPHQDDPDPARRREAHRYVAEIVKQSLTWATAGHIPAYQPVLQEPEYAALDPQSSYAGAAEVAVLDPPNWFTGSGSNFQNRMCQPLQSALLGNTSAEKAVRQMVREADALLRQPNPVA